MRRLTILICASDGNDDVVTEQAVFRHCITTSELEDLEKEWESYKGWEKLDPHFTSTIEESFPQVEDAKRETPASAVVAFFERLEHERYGKCSTFICPECAKGK